MTDDWSLCPLSAVAPVIKRGRAPSYADEGILVLNQKCVRPGNVIDYSVARRTDPSVKAIPEWAFLQVGDVLVNSTGRGTAGRAALVAQVRERATVDSHVTIVRSDTDLVVPAFVGIVLSSMPDTLEQLATGSTTQVELSRESIGQVILRLPPLSQQRRIVDLIGSIDTYIDRLEGQVDATRTARAGMLSELLSNPGADWQSTTLGTAFDIRMGRQRSPKNASGAHMVDYLRAANIKDGKVLLEDVKKMNFAPDEQATFRLDPGDVLVTEGCGSRDEVGASARWDSQIDGIVCFQNTLLRMRSVNGVSTPGFAEVIARFFYSSGRWADVASGTNIFHIGARRAESIPINLPPLEGQRRIVDLVGSFDEQILSLDSQVESARALRSGVLSELLSGERLLDDSYDMAVGL